MSAVALRVENAAEVDAPQWIDRLVQLVAANRFLPRPPDDLHCVGDGDFRLIGAEFLGHFVRLGGLRPTDRVLDLGCGVGRMAIPLTQYLDAERGRYDGVDVVRAGIRWCQERITPVYPRFRFHHLDMANPLYNPRGRETVSAARLPFDDGSFDFVIVTSVLTHLPAEDTVAYASEIARVLRAGGRCFVSLFLMTEAARRGLAEGKAGLAFPADGDGPAFYAEPEVPLAAVAYDEAALLAIFARAGLDLVGPPAYGRWAGRDDGLSYQDLCVFARRAGEVVAG